MSHKTNKSIARAMPKETILTRNKLAQLKQMRLRSNKIVKLNGNLQKRCRKRKLSLNKIDLKEFRPDKLKRKINSETISLKLKHNYTVVAKMNHCNKRKNIIPKKEIPQTESEASSSDAEELSVTELVQLYNATEKLTDEDFLEILTCPSPVWWEEPPPGYSEDPISVEFTVKKEVKKYKEAKNDKKLEDEKEIRHEKQDKILKEVTDEREDKVIARNTFELCKANIINEISNLDKINSSIKNHSDKDIKIDTKYTTKSKNLESVLNILKEKSNTSNNPCYNQNTTFKANYNAININNKVYDYVDLTKNTELKNYNDLVKKDLNPIIVIDLIND